MNRDLVLFTGKHSKRLFYAISIWILYALGSYFYAFDKRAVLHETAFLLSGFSLILVFQSFLKHVKFGPRVMLYACAAGLAGQLLINFIEIFQGIHLDGNFLEVVSLYDTNSLVKFIPAGTFDNPNNLAIFLNLAMLALLALFKLKPERSDLWLLLLVLSSVVLFSCYSRFGMINFIFIVALFPFFFNYPGYLRELILKTSSFRYIILGLVLSASVVLYNGMDYRSVEKTEGKSSDKSIAVRKNLILNGIDFFRASNGVGIGAGNFESYHTYSKIKYNTKGIINSHNWIIQILSQYGILITLLLFTWYVSTGWHIFKISISKTIQENTFRPFIVMVFIMMIIYPVISMMPSNFLQNPYNWLMLCLFAFVADHGKQMAQNEF
ncbi:MAG: O-antigen ligase family protein [Bacteroidetes bacterium]|nr:O-antigen ligase family protein [Bacteroidota bacterium]